MSHFSPSSTFSPFSLIFSNTKGVGPPAHPLNTPLDHLEFGYAIYRTTSVRGDLPLAIYVVFFPGLRLRTFENKPDPDRTFK